jgi:hypothetical protein
LPADLTVHISGSNQSNACALTTTAAFSLGSFTGDKINVSGLADGHKIYSGAIVSGAGVAPNTIIVGKGGNPRRSENGVYYVSPSQTVKGPVAMTASVNGAVPGMLVTVSAASNSAYNGIYAVQPGVSPEAIPINLDCSRLGPLASATLTYSGSANYVTYLRRMAYYSPDLVTLTQQLYATLESLGGSQPSQFTIGQPFGGAAGWGAFFSDIYGYNPAAASTSSSVAGERLNVGGTVTGRFDVGQTIFGAGIPPNTKITSVVTGRGGPGTYRLSRSAPSPLNNIGIQGNVTGPSAQWIAIQSWNKHRQD